ncbi:MAG: head-tail connector protein [Allosphingosinicella sp.]
MRYRIRTVTAPGDIPLPFDLDEARQELRVEEGEVLEDALIEAKLRSAMDWVERFTGQVLSDRALELVLDGLPRAPELIELPRAPVTAIGGISYVSADDGSTVVLVEADWRWSDSDPEWLRPAFRTAWPVAATERGSVRVAFQAGYEAGLAPPALLAAVKAMLVQSFENRDGGEDVPERVVDLCRPFRRVLI